MNRPRGGRVLVIGLGNRIRGDDGAGPRVAELVAERAPELEAIAWEREPTDLLTLWGDAALVVLVDAVAGARPGSWHRLELGEGPLPRRPGPTASTHVLTLAEVIELGRELARMPARLVIFGVEAAGFEVGARLSPAVAAAIDPLADAVLAEVRAAELGRGSARRRRLGDAHLARRVPEPLLDYGINVRRKPGSAILTGTPAGDQPVE